MNKRVPSPKEEKILHQKMRSHRQLLWRNAEIINEMIK